MGFVDRALSTHAALVGAQLDSHRKEAFERQRLAVVAHTCKVDKSVGLQPSRVHNMTRSNPHPVAENR